MSYFTLEEVQARIDAIFAKHRQFAEDNPDSMRYHLADQGGSTKGDYEAMDEAAPWIALRDKLRRN